MKNVKRTVAALVCIALAVACFAGCHKKNETAVKIGDYTFTAGYYACALVYADTEGRQKVDEELEAKGKSIEDVKYINKKIDGKTFEKWVKDRAIENLKINAGYMQLCKEMKITLTDSDIEIAKNYANNYWQYYGYSEIFGANGVSKETLEQYTVDTYYSEKYFDAVYGKEGTNPVSEEELKTALGENYVAVYKLETDTASLSDDDKTAKKAEYQIYLDQYKAGTPFEEIYNSANPEEEAEEEDGTDTEESEDGTADNTEEQTEEPAEETAEETTEEATPLDKHAELLGSEKTNSSSDFFEEVSKLNVGDGQIFETDDQIVLIIKLDVNADPYYLTEKDEDLRKICAGDKSNEDATKKADSLKTEIVAYAVDRFKVKNITYPDSVTVG